MNSVPDQEVPEPPQVKEAQEELCSGQEGEQLVVKLEANTTMVTPIFEENQQSEAEPNGEQPFSHHSAGTEIQDEEGSRHVDSGSSKEEEPKSKKRRLETRSHSNSDDDCLTSVTLCENETDAPQLLDFKEEALTVRQLCNQKNSILDQEEQDAAQVKKEEKDLSTNQEEEHFGVKQKADIFMVTPTEEDNDNREIEQNSEQLLFHNAPDTESKDQGAGKNVNPGSSKHEELTSKNCLHRNRSDSINVDNSSMSENRCNTGTAEKSIKCSVNDKDRTNGSKKKKHRTADKPHVCSTCGKRFRDRGYLSVHERIHSGEKPFSCGTCRKSFNRRANLKTHMNIHTVAVCGQSGTVTLIPMDNTLGLFQLTLLVCGRSTCTTRCIKNQEVAINFWVLSHFLLI
ncbi:uncharacterized protein KZ484_011044 [Pholidichthys leucotaenia]